MYNFSSNFVYLDEVVQDDKLVGFWENNKTEKIRKNHFYHGNGTGMYVVV